MSDDNKFAIIGAVVGTAVGYYFGNPKAGFAIGSMAGRMIDNAVADKDPNGVFEPDSLLGTGITAPTLGKFVSVVFGTYRIPGNIIWSSGRTEFENRSTTGGTPTGGKGGFGGPQSQTATTSRTYEISVAISLADHPIERVSRIWADATLLFDDSDQDNVTISAGTPTGDFAAEPDDNAPVKIAAHIDSTQEFILFRGTEEQEPSSFIESFEGVGKVPAYKGVAYILMKNLDLGSIGRVPNFTFEVVVGKSPNNTPKDLTTADDKTIVVFPKSLIDSPNAPSGTSVVTYNQNNLEPIGQFDLGSGDPIQAEFGDVAGVDGVYILKANHKIAAMNASGSTQIEGTDFRTTQEIFDKTDPGVQSFRMIIPGSAFTRVDTALLTLITSNEVLKISFGNTPDTPTFTRATTAAGPKDAIFNLGNGSIYVSCSQADSVQKWDSTLTTLQDTIILGNNPQALVEDDAGKVWACNVDDNTVQHFTTDADKSSAISVGTTPTTIVKASDGFLWTLNIGNKTVSRIDHLTPFTVQNFTLPANGTTLEAGINNDVWVTDLANNAVYRVESNGTVTTIRVARGPQNLATDTDGNVWVANTTARTLTRISADGTEILTPENHNGLACVVRTLNEMAGLDSSEIDVAGLDNTPVNMAITGFGAAKIPLENLALVYSFLGVESGDVIKYFFKGGTSVATIPEECLAASQDSPSENSFAVVRQQEIEVPTSITLKYASILRNYQEATQRLALSTFLTPKNPLVINLPMALDDIQGRNAVEIMLYEGQFARTNYKFSLPHKFSLLEPGDIIDVTSRGIAHRMRLTSIVQNAKGDLEFDGVFHRSFIYQDFVGVPGDAPQASGLAGLADVGMAFVDAPALDIADGGDTRYFAAFHPNDAKSFPSTTLFESRDAQASFSALLTSSKTAIVGDVSGILASGITHTWDDANTIDVVLKSAAHQLNTVSDLAVLNGANLAMIGNEVLQFQTATLIATQTYRLSRLLRGRLGSESFVGTHAANEKFVFLDSVLRNNLRVVYDPIRLGAQSDFKVVPQNQNITDITATQFTPQGVSIKPWAPVVRPELLVSNDWTFTWYERARINNGLVDFTGLNRDPLLTGFRVKVYQDGTFTTVVRTEDIGLLVSSDDAHTFDYTAAKQTTDFGSTQAQVFYEVLGIGPGIEGYTTQRDTGAPPFSIDAVSVIGTTHGSRSGAFNTADAKTGIFSAWIKMDGGNGVTQQLVWIEQSGLVRFSVERFNNNTLTVFARNSSGSTRLHMESTGTITTTNGWVHVLCAWDTAVAANNWIFITDVDQTSIITRVDGAIDYTGTSNGLLGRVSGAERFNGCVADLYFAPGQFLDLSLTANRRKFISSAGKPIDIGSDGSTPTGTQPLLFHVGNDASPNDFITVEKGSNDTAFIKSGSNATACATSPTD